MILFIYRCKQNWPAVMPSEVDGANGVDGLFLWPVSHRVCLVLTFVCCWVYLWYICWLRSSMLTAWSYTVNHHWLWCSLRIRGMFVPGLTHHILRFGSFVSLYAYTDIVRPLLTQSYLLFPCPSHIFMRSPACVCLTKCWTYSLVFNPPGIVLHESCCIAL